MTYEPKQAQLDTPIRQAIEILEGKMDQYGVHTVYEGRNLIKGEDCGAAVVCVVEDKGPRAYNSQIPAFIETPSGNIIPTDVVVGPPPKDLRLMLPEVRAYNADLQRCYDVPIPGGVQIAPQGAPWVGTLGIAVKFKAGGYGFITNEHVSGEGNVGGKCCQPSGNSGWIGEFKAVGGLRYDRPCYIDAAAAVAYRTDGPYAPGTHLVIPQQRTLGKITPRFVRAYVGMKAVKEGRTSGVTRGKCVGIGGSSRVGYDRGSILLRDLDIYEAHSGVMSIPGDSGSCIFCDEEPDLMCPSSLLFAGGGGQTLGCRMDYVLDAFQAELFSV